MGGFWGRRGSGKSTQGKQQLRAVSHGVVFDPMAEYAKIRGFKACHSLDQVKAAMKAGWVKGFKIAFVPRAGFEAEDLHALSNLLMQVQEASGYGVSHGRHLLLLVEEMQVSFPVHSLPRELNGFMALCSRGRHYGINVIGISQRVAEVNNRFRGNCAFQRFYAQANPTDIRTIAQSIGKERAASLMSIPNHHYFEVTASGQVTKGKNNVKF